MSLYSDGMKESQRTFPLATVEEDTKIWLSNVKIKYVNYVYLYAICKKTGMPSDARVPRAIILYRSTHV